nr:uncharacterized protein LOC127339700 [Lolium perenne]
MGNGGKWQWACQTEGFYIPRRFRSLATSDYTSPTPPLPCHVAGHVANLERNESRVWLFESPPRRTSALPPARLDAASFPRRRRAAPAAASEGTRPPPRLSFPRRRALLPAPRLSFRAAAASLLPAPRRSFPSRRASPSRAAAPLLPKPPPLRSFRAAAPLLPAPRLSFPRRRAAPSQAASAPSRAAPLLPAPPPRRSFPSRPRAAPSRAAAALLGRRPRTAPAAASEDLRAGTTRVGSRTRANGASPLAGRVIPPILLIRPIQHILGCGDDTCGMVEGDFAEWWSLVVRTAPRQLRKGPSS